MNKQEEQAYINDTFDTMAQILAHKFCLNKEVVKRWLNKKGYTTKDFGEVIEQTKRDEWLAEVIWA